MATILTQSEVLSLATNNADITTDLIVSCATESLALTENNAIVVKGNQFLVIGATVELTTLTEQNATVTRQRLVTAITEALQLTENNASLNLGSVISDSVNASDSVTEFAEITQPLLTDSLDASDAVTDQVGSNVSDPLNASDSVTDQIDALDIVSDTLIASDSLQANITEPLLTDSLNAADAVIHEFTDAVSDAAEASDAVTQVATASSAVTDSLLAEDSVPGESEPGVWIDSVTDTLNASDSLGDLHIVLEIVQDTVTAVDAVISYAGALDQLVDVVIAQDSVPWIPATVSDAVTDEAIVQDFVYSADPDALAWIVNTETGAPWYYTNFNFYDVVEQAGMLFGAAEDGLYLLQGDDDAGSEIDSELITGFMDFGSDQKKRLPDIYIGYTGGELECDVETYDQPTDIYTYGLESREASAPRNNRIRLGKGLVSRYWRVTLRNVAGAAYHVYDTVADVVASKRRL